MDATYYFARCFVVLLYLDLIVAMSMEVALRRAVLRCVRSAESLCAVLLCIALCRVVLCSVA